MIKSSKIKIYRERTTLMNIIQEALEIIIIAYQENLQKALSGNINFNEFTKNLETELHKAGTLMVGEALETLDRTVKESKDRKKNWYVERIKDINSLATTMGLVTYKRTYYTHKKTKEYAYLSDELVGIETHQRKDLNVATMLVSKATDKSYQQVADETSFCGIHSKTTVMNEIRKLGAIPNEAVAIDKTKRDTPILYIEADEDHVALQNGSKDIVKIIYVHEGRQKISKGRNKLLNVRYFTGAKQSSEELWLDVAKYIDEAYNSETITKVFISGDGAFWIKEGLNWIAKSEFVLDKFHLAKYIRAATAHLDYTREPLWNYIYQGMKNATEELFDIMLSNTEDQHKRKVILDAKKYVLNNWKAIQRQESREYIGCSAEGHVSHVLSDRLSSRPKGWSEDGMEQMARLRVFSFNGGDISEYMMKRKETQIKEKRVIKLDARIIKKHHRISCETLDNITIMNIGKTNSASKWLKAVRGL
jgi:hypothetical protein